VKSVGFAAAAADLGTGAAHAGGGVLRAVGRRDRRVDVFERGGGAASEVGRPVPARLGHASAHACGAAQHCAVRSIPGRGCGISCWQ
jgi:hypothetical protein